MVRRFTVAVLTLFVIAGIATLVAVMPERSTATPERRQPPPQPVVLAAVEQRAVPLTIAAIGNAQPLQTVGIKPRIDGQIVSVHFEEGQNVAAGDVLFRLDDRSYRIQLRQAEAALANAKAQLDRARADFRRTSDLMRTGNATAQRYDEVKASLEALEGTVKADEAAIDAARLNLDYTVIRAPFAGRTGAIQFRVGSMVRTNDSAPLVTLTQLSPIAVAFSVPERELPEVRRAQRAAPLAVHTAPRSAGEDAVEGRLVFIDSAIDTATGTILLKARFDNDPPLLWPGQFVDVTLAIGAPAPVLVVPAQAIQMGQDGSFVYVAGSDGTVKLRPVEVARRAGELAVIAAGVSAGERVVAEGQSRLSDGATYAEANRAGGGRERASR